VRTLLDTQGIQVNARDMVSSPRKWIGERGEERRGEERRGEERRVEGDERNRKDCGRGGDSSSRLEHRERLRSEESRIQILRVEKERKERG